MTEDIVNFVWKYNSPILQDIYLDDNKQVEVISPGEHNFDSGPDFFNAKVKIENTVWAGNVEIHLNASDWNKHGHNTNPAYDSVILHVVVKNDTTVYNSRGEIVPTVQIPYPSTLEWDLQQLVANEAWIPCANKLKGLERFTVRMWLASLAVERLEQKTIQVNDLVKELKGSWEEAFYISIARSFGLKINALPFELLAKSTPIKILAKVRSSILSIEAILFGQAGMLETIDSSADEYIFNLKKEYDYQQKKYSLTPIPNHLWKFMRLRPISFPTIRIAQFAQLIHQSSGLFSNCMEAKGFESILQLLKVGCSSYWQTHYTFGKESTLKPKIMGDDTIRIIILNTIVPFMFAYGSARGDEQLKDKALNILESMKPENNNVVKGFSLSGLKPENAFFSQAMVQLKSQYCDKRKCLFCQVGVSLLLKKAE